MVPNCRHRKESYGIIEHQIALQEQLRIAKTQSDAAFTDGHPDEEILYHLKEVNRLLNIIAEARKGEANLDLHEKQLLVNKKQE